MVIDGKFYQFVLSAIALIGLIIIFAIGKENATLISLLSAIAGAGAWGGARDAVVSKAVNSVADKVTQSVSNPQ